MSGVTLDSVSVGQQLPSQSFELERLSMIRYAGASGDFNPIHYRDDFAKSVGLPGVIAHGMLTMGLSVQVAVDWVGDPGKVSDYSTRFTKMVDVDAEEGAVLVVTGKIAEIDTENNEVRVDLTTMFGEIAVLGKAQVRVRL